MSKICLYFELHQPYRLKPFSIFDVGQKKSYFGDAAVDQNKEIFEKVAKKSYIPMLSLLLDLVNQHPQFVFAFSTSGVFLEQAEQYSPYIIHLLKQLVKTGQVEVLAETYYHSLASLYSPKEFARQVKQHQKKIESLFSVTPKVFRNTELIYSDHIGELVAELGYTGILTEAVDRYLGGQPRTQLFSTFTKKRIPMMLKHAQLSDDVAFRFSDKNWTSFPLHADTYVHWLNDYQEHEYVNLFMDFETFGEHQWEDTGIFKFFAKTVEELLNYPWNRFVTPTQVMGKVDAKELPYYKVPQPISWADIDRDLSAWRDNDLQQDTLRTIYALEDEVLETQDDRLIDDWRRLQTSDHFYYMCIKWSADGDVHAYFSPYSDPLDAYVRYTTVLADIKSRLLTYSIKN